MLARVFVNVFGNVWSLKKNCSSKSSLISKISRTIYGYYQYENNSSIAWNSSFKSEPCFPHGMKGIFVSGGAKIGDGCVIFQQVTIGSVLIVGSKNMGAPSLGDNVYIGAGAKIIGGIIIGNNVRIGANAVVYRDVPDNCVVVGQQRVIRKDGFLDNRFYSFHGQWVYFDSGDYKPVVNKDTLQELEGLR